MVIQPQTLWSVRQKYTFMERGWQEKKIGSYILIFISIAALALCIPAVSAAIPDNNQQVSGITTPHDLNVTNASFPNRTIPDEYRITPTLIDIKVKITETLLPGPKGEMAASPRFIGFSTTPETLIIVIFVVAAGIAGLWYAVTRRRKERE